MGELCYGTGLTVEQHVCLLELILGSEFLVMEFCLYCGESVFCFHCILLKFVQIATLLDNGFVLFHHLDLIAPKQCTL